MRTQIYLFFPSVCLFSLLQKVFLQLNHLQDIDWLSQISAFLAKTFIWATILFQNLKKQLLEQIPMIYAGLMDQTLTGCSNHRMFSSPTLPRSEGIRSCGIFLQSAQITQVIRGPLQISNVPRISQESL